LWKKESGTISKHIYGHLRRCIYGGYRVGEDSPIPNTRGIRNNVAQALRDIQLPDGAYYENDRFGPVHYSPFSNLEFRIL
jgi:alpha-L-arabinofuranosidase